MKLSNKRRKEWLKKCNEYASFLKEDFDFDYEYILRLLCYKLRRTKCCIMNGYTSNREQCGKEIQEVEDLLLKVLKHDYDAEATAKYYKKYGKPKIVSIPHTKHTCTIDFIYRNGKPATKTMNREFIKASKMAHQNRKSDLKRAFQLMTENIWGWWD